MVLYMEELNGRAGYGDVKYEEKTDNLHGA